MAKLLLKHFGIGGKKNPPATPKPDYNNSQKATSVQDLTGRYQSSEHSCHGLCTSGSNFATYDGRSHNRTRDSPRFHRPFSTHSPISKQRDLGHNSSTPASGDSPPGKEKNPANSGAASSLPSSELGSPLEDKSGGNPTPPRLLDEYSDPFDLKKQIAEHSESLGSLGVEEDKKSVSDDDYSVPFEIKNMRDKKMREKEKQSKQNAARYENAKFEQQEQGAVGGMTTHPTTQQQPPQLSENDLRPKEEYDDPWEWSTTHSIIFKEGEKVIPPHCVKAFPDQSSRKTKQQLPPPQSSTDVVASSAAEKQQPTGKMTNAVGVAAKQDRHDYVNTNIQPPTGRDAEGRNVVRDGGEKVKSGDVSASSASEKGAAIGGGGARPKDSAQGGTCHDRRLGNYEEPWDLTYTRDKLEECFKAKISTSDDCATAQGEEKPPPQAAAGGAPPPQQSGPDTRPQEGYEKPWDWKPDRKDDRQQEGYEKPWDWKPHQKDDRPMAEYDQPWDQKQAQLQQNLLKAKSAKEIKGSASLGMESQSLGKQAHDVRPKLDKSRDNTKSMVASDTRPMDEYDQPWDKKTARQNFSRTMNESSSQSQSAVLASPHHGPRSSPSHKHLSQPPQAQQPQVAAATSYHRSSVPWGTGTVGERIDPSIALEKQGWYHGAISRVDAEGLLRVHKEGSYLVRMSESNKLDFSLSLKSSRGFMHMKIVSKNGKYILGQFSQPFDCIPLMIHHYSINKLPIKGAEHMSLLHPIMHELL